VVEIERMKRSMASPQVISLVVFYFITHFQGETIMTVDRSLAFQFVGIFSLLLSAINTLALLFLSSIGVVFSTVVALISLSDKSTSLRSTDSAVYYNSINYPDELKPLI
jgi:hypothetical protein